MMSDKEQKPADSLSPETIDYLLELLRLRSMGLPGPWKAKEKDMILELERLAENSTNASGPISVVAKDTDFGSCCSHESRLVERATGIERCQRCGEQLSSGYEEGE